MRWTGSEGAQLGMVRAEPGQPLAEGFALWNRALWMLQLLCSALERECSPWRKERQLHRGGPSARDPCSQQRTHTLISWQAVPATLEAKAINLQRPKNTFHVRDHSTLQSDQAGGQDVIWGRRALCRNQARIQGISEDIQTPSSTKVLF